MWIGTFCGGPNRIAVLSLIRPDVAASGELVTRVPIPRTAVWISLEGSGAFADESIVLLSVLDDPQKRTGFSQGNMPGMELVSEQGGNVEAIDVPGAAMLKQKAPTK